MLETNKIKKDKNTRLLVKTAAIPFSGKFASAVGRCPALIAQQLNYKLTTEEEYNIGKVIDDRRWIYNTYDDWCKELNHYSECTIRRAIKKLEDLGIIDSKQLNAYKGDQTKWYTINYEVLQKLFPWIFNQENPVTTEKTAKTTKKPPLNPHSSSPDQNDLLYIQKQKGTYISSITSNKSSSKKLTGKLKAKNRQEGKLAKINSKSSKTLIETKNTESKLTDVNKLNVAMKQTWERVVEGKNNSIYLTKKLCKFFMAAFKRKFNNSLEQWEAFCKKITTSAFLMGKSSTPFKASLEWALRFDVIDKIFNGHYGVKEVKQEAPVQTQERLEALEQQINSAPESAIIKSFRKGILKAVGVNVYSSWFKNTHIIEQNNTFSVTAESKFQTDYIHTHFGQTLSKLMGG